MIKIKSMLKILENWLGMSNAAEIFYIGGSDVLPPPLSHDEFFLRRFHPKRKKRCSKNLIKAARRRALCL